jgi:hypothetical protein
MFLWSLVEMPGIS